MGVGQGYLQSHLSFPLYGLMASRYRRESAVTWHLQERDSHPHGHSVVMVLFQSIRGTGAMRIILRTLSGSSFYLTNRT